MVVTGVLFVSDATPSTIISIQDKFYNQFARAKGKWSFEFKLFRDNTNVRFVQGETLVPLLNPHVFIGDRKLGAESLRNQQEKSSETPGGSGGSGSSGGSSTVPQNTPQTTPQPVGPAARSNRKISTKSAITLGRYGQDATKSTDLFAPLIPTEKFLYALTFSTHPRSTICLVDNGKSPLGVSKSAQIVSTSPVPGGLSRPVSHNVESSGLYPIPAQVPTPNAPVEPSFDHIPFRDNGKEIGRDIPLPPADIPLKSVPFFGSEFAGLPLRRLGMANGDDTGVASIIQSKMSSLWTLRQTIKGEGGQAFELEVPIDGMAQKFHVRLANTFINGSFRGLLIEVGFEPRSENPVKLSYEGSTEFAEEAASLLPGYGNCYFLQIYKFIRNFQLPGGKMCWGVPRQNLSRLKDEEKFEWSLLDTAWQYAEALQV